MTVTNNKTLSDANIDKLLARAGREVDEGLLPSAQVALAFNGEVVAEEAFGDATVDTRYCIFSATKPFVASVVWTIMAEGLVDLTRPVVHYVSEFAGDGPDAEAKANITVEQVMLHTAGFPHAPLSPPVWDTAETRVAAMAAWKLNWEPGTRFEYHATSAHWVLAELIDRVTGSDYRDVLEQRITGPAGLPRILGIAPDDQGDIADLALTGEPATADELEAAFGVRELPETEVTDDAVLAFNRPDVRAVGVPGGGGMARARDLALFYQELLHNPNGIWDPAILADAVGTVRNNLPDPFGIPANRALGVIVAGDDGLANIRGLGRTVSPAAFGHNGAGGQLAWADPATGLSLGYTTNGYDRNEVRQPRRGTAISSIAAECAVDIS